MSAWEPIVGKEVRNPQKWDYLDEKIDITDVIKKYDEFGFDANQDSPGNFLWEELYHASPKDTKVILTVRDSDEKMVEKLAWIFETGIHS